jgi:preprotein translocase subunit SecB
MAKQPAAPAEAEDQLPQLSVLAQYIKDLSFENPNAPKSLAPQNAAPDLQIQVNVNGKPLSDTDYEVELTIEGQAGKAPNLLFGVQLNYCGVLRIVNVPKDSIHPVVMIEGPRLLFPFARQIIADAVRHGGFPPLLIDPVDFAALYRSRLEEIQAEEAKKGKK